MRITRQKFKEYVANAADATPLTKSEREKIDRVASSTRVALTGGFKASTEGLKCPLNQAGLAEGERPEQVRLKAGVEAVKTFYRIFDRSMEVYSVETRQNFDGIVYIDTSAPSPLAPLPAPAFGKTSYPSPMKLYSSPPFTSDYKKLASSYLGSI